MRLEELRTTVDEIDNKLIALLGERMRIIKSISHIKKAEKNGIVDENREKDIIERMKKKSKEHGLNEEFIMEIFEIILNNSRKVQENEIIK